MTEWVVITGASSGIGKDAAQRMARAGWKVIPCVRKAADLAEWEKAGLHPVILDVTQPEQLGTALEKIRNFTAGSAKVHLVNNAGIVSAGPVEAVPLEKWREVFEVNVIGLVRLTQALLPLIRSTKGRIINISSISGILAAPYLAPYASSKFAVEAISDSLRREVAQFGVHVALIEPGPIATPIWEKNFLKKEDLYAGFSPNLRATYSRGLERFEAVVKQSAESALPVAAVSDAIFHALTHKRPRLRYLVGVKSISLQVFLARILPARWLDKLIARDFDR